MDIRRKMEDFSVNPPDDGWNKVERSLVNSPQKRRVFPLKYRLLVSAAVIASLIGFFSILHYVYSPSYMMKKEAATVSVASSVSHCNNTKVPAANISNTSGTNSLFARVSANGSGSVNNSGSNNSSLPGGSTNAIPATHALNETLTKSEQTNVPQQKTSQSEQVLPPSQQTTTSQQTSQTQQTSKSVHTSQHEQHNNQTTTRRIYRHNNSQTELEGKYKHGGWSMSLAMASAGSGNMQAEGNSAPMADDCYDWLNTSLLSKNDRSDLIGESRVKLKHRQPIHLGITVSKRLSNRFSLQTGLTGTYLLSVPKDDALGSNYDQHIYYVGIPVSLSYLLYRYNSFSVYWSNGVEVEKCVYAKQGDTNLKMHKLQWSVNSAIGAQYHIARHLAVFVEPGVSYYWGNGTDIKTYRTEHPCSVDIHFGLKLDY